MNMNRKTMFATPAMKHDKLKEYEIIDGKPYGGKWFGHHILCIKNDVHGYPHKKECEELLDGKFNDKFKEFEVRHKEFVFKENYFYPLASFDSVGLKALIWGRAYKIHRLSKTGCRRYKKTRVAGRMKWTRIK